MYMYDVYNMHKYSTTTTTTVQYMYYATSFLHHFLVDNLYV
jgi:hypothetical protein